MFKIISDLLKVKMFDREIYKQSNAFTLVELMIVIAIISILSSIAIPNFFSYRERTYCTEAEIDAENVGIAVSDYYGVPYRVNIPNVGDLNVETNNPIEIIGHPDNIIEIRVTDRTGRCPVAYQQSQQNWNSNIFSKFIR
jgi:type IV pilus assembly protein PilA